MPSSDGRLGKVPSNLPFSGHRIAPDPARAERPGTRQANSPNRGSDGRPRKCPRFRSFCGAQRRRFLPLG